MSDTTYKQFVKRWEEVTDLPPQTVGPLTPVYKRFTKHLKVMPWPVLVVLSICIVIGVFLLVGSTITFVVSLLQRGF
jgi:hypothetical protein